MAASSSIGSDLDDILSSLASESTQSEESWYEIPLQYKPQLEDWADELSVIHAKIINVLVRHSGMAEADRNPIASILCDCVVLTTQIDELLLWDEEDIKLQSYLKCASSWEKFELRWAALSLPTDCL